MGSAIKKTFLGHSVNCVVCNKYTHCQHHDTELRGPVCFGCLPYLALAEVTLRGSGLPQATEWNET